MLLLLRFLRFLRFFENPKKRDFFTFFCFSSHVFSNCGLPPTVKIAMLSECGNQSHSIITIIVVLSQLKRPCYSATCISPSGVDVFRIGGEERGPKGRGGGGVLGRC